MELDTIRSKRRRKRRSLCKKCETPMPDIKEIIDYIKTELEKIGFDGYINNFKTGSSYIQYNDINDNRVHIRVSDHKSYTFTTGFLICDWIESQPFHYDSEIYTLKDAVACIDFIKKQQFKQNYGIERLYKEAN